MFLFKIEAKEMRFAQRGPSPWFRRFVFETKRVGVILHAMRV